MNAHSTPAGGIRLNPGLEILSGPNGVPLLYVGERRTYVRLSETAANVVRWLEGRAVTADAMSDYLAQEHRATDGEIDASVARFLTELDRVGALARDDRPDAPRASWYRTAARYLAKSPRLRLLAWRIDRPIAPRAMATVRRLAGSRAPAAIVVATVSALACVAGAAMSANKPICPATVPMWLFASALAAHTVAHELAHALTASYFGVKVREFGVGLLYYMIPVAYTDRTDSYRLTSVHSRAAIALAGPAFDLCAAGLSALATTLTAEAWSPDVQVLSAHLRLLM
jgi:putative peptide zinc metalloprotease protein